MFLDKLFQIFNKDKKVQVLSYPNKYDGNKQDRVVNITGSATAVADTKMAILTITPNGITPYTVNGVYVSNIIGNICTIDVHVEVTPGEGAIADNKRDSKDYAGTETFGGYIASYSSYTTSYIQITNSSGGALTFDFNGLVYGDVSYTITKTT